MIETTSPRGSGSAVLLILALVVVGAVGFGGGWLLGRSGSAVNATSPAVQTAEQERDEAQARADELQRERDQLRQQVHELEARLASGREDDGEMVAGYSMLETERDQLQSRVRFLEEELADMEARLRDAEFQLNSTR